MTPLETAKFWVEYVLRHNGAPHLRSAAIQMKTIEYYNIDAYTILTIPLIVIIAITTCLIKCVFKKIFVTKDKIKLN